MARFWLTAVLAVQALGLATKVTPMGKVIELLKKLEAQVSAEGKKEAKAYDDFACYCKEQLVEKVNDMDRLRASIDLEQRHNETASAHLVTENVNIEEAQTDKTNAEDAVEQLTNQMTTDYDAAQGHLDALMRGINGIKGAVEMLRAARDAQTGTGGGGARLFAQIKARMPPIVLAEMDRTVSQQPVSTFGSNEVLELLATMQETFETRHREAERAQRDARAEKQALIAIQQNNLRVATQKLEAAQTAAAEATEHQQKAESSLAELNRDLNTQQDFTEDLQEQCHAKAVQWDARKAKREEEVRALQQALRILEQGAVPNAQAITVTSPGNFLAKKAVVKHRDAMIEEVMPEVDELVALESFVQLSMTKSNFRRVSKPTRSRQAAAIEFLANQARKMGGSVALSTLVMKATADPFAGVKRMIHALITSLEEQRSDRHGEKEFCETEMSNAQATEDEKMAVVTTQKGAMAAAKKAKEEAEAELNAKEQEKADAVKGQQEQSQLHAEFTTQNASTKEQAEEGRDAVIEALQVLRTFYNSFIQQPVMDTNGNVVTDTTGFSSDDGSSTEEAGGIIGILEMLQADFERTVQEMIDEKADADAENSRMDGAFTTTISTADARITTLKSDVSGAQSDYDTAEQVHDLAASELKTTQDYLAQIKKQCVDGESFEERTQKREAEIASLKEALEILEGVDVQLKRTGV